LYSTFIGAVAAYLGRRSLKPENVEETCSTNKQYFPFRSKLKNYEQIFCTVSAILPKCTGLGTFVKM